VSSVGSFFSYVNDARSHEPEIFCIFGRTSGMRVGPIKCPCYEYIVFGIAGSVSYITEEILCTCEHRQMSYFI